MKELIHYNDIVHYVEGRMAPEATKAFEQRLQLDPSLKEEYQLYLSGLEVAEIFAMEQLGALVSTIRQPPQGRTRRLVGLRPLLSIAAGVCLLILGLSAWWANSQFSNQRLVASHYVAPNLSLVRGQSEGDEDLQLAFTYYYRTDYESAVALLTQRIKLGEASLETKWLLGHVYLKAGQPLRAIPYFEDLAYGNSTAYQNNAHWHLLLAQLQAGNMEQARHLILEITTASNHPYAGKARLLEKQMDSHWRLFCW